MEHPPQQQVLPRVNADENSQDSIITGRPVFANSEQSPTSPDLLLIQTCCKVRAGLNAIFCIFPSFRGIMLKFSDWLGVLCFFPLWPSCAFSSHGVHQGSRLCPVIFKSTCYADEPATFSSHSSVRVSWCLEHSRLWNSTQCQVCLFSQILLQINLFMTAVALFLIYFIDFCCIIFCYAPYFIVVLLHCVCLARLSGSVVNCHLRFYGAFAALYAAMFCCSL